MRGNPGRGVGELAKSEIQIRGDLNTAVQSFVNSVTYMGGSVTSMNPARPVEFSVRRSASMLGGMGAPYSGNAKFIPTGNDQTRALVELKPKLWYGALLVVVGVVALALVGFATTDPEILATLGLAVLAAVGVTLYFYYVSWPQKVIERIQLGVHGAVSAFDAPAAPAGAQHFAVPPQPAPAGVPPQAPPAAPTASVTEQLRQLGELHQQGLITDTEFEAKKAEVLKRI